LGLGRRVGPRDRRGDEFSLAGGVGVVVDGEGRDRYDSSNFSQGCGYFFGAGVKLDLAGDDVHRAARYGQAAGAHYGMGLFVDYAGKDEYASAGPTYTGACAWDRTLALLVDGGGDDAYDWAQTSGGGRADIGGWAVFAELGGVDRYVTGSGLGAASQDGLAVFFDRAGKDDYAKAAGPGDFKPANGETEVLPPGGLFADRP
jgi:hypothetical protein